MAALAQLIDAQWIRMLGKKYRASPYFVIMESDGFCQAFLSIMHLLKDLGTSARCKSTPRTVNKLAHFLFRLLPSLSCYLQYQYNTVQNYHSIIQSFQYSNFKD